MQDGDNKTLLALDHVQESAALGLAVLTELLTAASAGDLAGVEARLWAWRRILSECIQTWRAAVPARKPEDGE
jgi:hypothetical protein